MSTPQQRDLIERLLRPFAEDWTFRGTCCNLTKDTTLSPEEQQTLKEASKILKKRASSKRLAREMEDSLGL